MDRIIYITMIVTALAGDAGALKRKAEYFEKIGRAALSTSIVQSSPKQLISLLSHEETKSLIANDEELLEAVAERASVLASDMSPSEKSQMRVCLEELQAAQAPEEIESSNELWRKRRKLDSKAADNHQDQTSALIEVTGILAQTGLNITAQLQERRFEQDYLKKALLASTADALLGTNNSQIANTVTACTAANKPIVAKTLAENIGNAFAAIVAAFKK